MKIIELAGADLTYFLTACQHINDNGCHSLLVAIDDIDAALKMKIDGGTWSPPMGMAVTP